jgi:hypothetical protein
MAAKLASAARLQEKMDELEMEDDVVAEPLDDSLDMTMGTVDTVATVETQKETQKKKIKRKTPPKKSSPKADLLYPTMDDPTPDHVSAAQYENLESMMSQFCRVPLLAEFSRPVALLHPEVCHVVLWSSVTEPRRFFTDDVLACVLFSSWWHIPRLSNTQLILVTFAAKFASENTLAFEIFNSMPGESFPTAYAIIHILRIRRPCRPLSRLPCICATTLMRSGKSI